MKKICFLLATLLLAAPALCDINVTCDSNGAEVTVSYESTDSNLPRAFGLDISIDSGATIESIDYNDPNFWVHPGNIVITDGDVTTEGSPVAPNDAPGAQGGLDTGAMTIEMGSLYDDEDANHPDPPALSGVLLKFTVSGDCNVTIAGNAARGNVVMEDTTEATVSYTGCTVTAETECYTGPDYAEWVAVGKPDCWCASINPRQCRGDTDGATETKGNYWVYTNDLSNLMSAWGKPLASMSGDEICADFNHDSETKGNYRVYTGDLSTLMTNWGSASTPADCP
jgi:hypothetical protein